MEEYGHLNGEDKNRYWEIKLSRLPFLINCIDTIREVVWHIATLIMLIPLFITARYYSSKLQLVTKKKGKVKGVPYQNFTDIYPGCVYSPLVKGYELELFRNCELNEPILEIGIGDGYFTSLLFRFKNEKVTYGGDLIYQTLKSAMKYEQCENYLIMDASQIPLPDNSLGTVIMNNLMHHLPDRLLVLDEVLRVLKNGGKFIFTDNKIGWGVFTWEQCLLRKLRLAGIAQKILKFKLRLFAQKLLVNDYYYEEVNKKRNFKIVDNVNFVSKKSMYLSSIFEFLNLKQGQPTRAEMIRWINLFGLRDEIIGYISDIIEYCFLKDKELGERNEYAFQFVNLEKLGETGSDNKFNSKSIPYVCPECKEILGKIGNWFICDCCNTRFPIIEGIPVLISYQAKLKGFESYMANTSKEKSREYIT